MGIFRVSSPEGAAEAERVMGEAEGTDAPALPPACTSQVLSCLFPRYLPRSFPGALAVWGWWEWLGPDQKACCTPLLSSAAH